MAEPTILSLLPPALALTAALVTRHVVLSLAIGGLSGFIVAAGGHPLDGTLRFLEEGLVAQLADRSHAALLVLILVIGGFVGLLEQSRGMVAFALRIARWVRGAVGAQLAVWVGGLVIFFSDSATPLILGPIFRPVLRRAGISREKLAYIIDSTASPVCVLVPFISWGIYVMSLIDQSFAHLGIEGDGLETFLQALPFQFYPILALLAVPLIVLTRREMGPMSKTTPESAEQEGAEGDAQGAKAPPLRVITAPLGTLVAAMAGLSAFTYATQGEITGESIKASLTLAYLLGAAAAAVVLWHARIMSPQESGRAFRRGVEKMLIIPLILLLAWTLGLTCQQVGTGIYLAAITQKLLTPGALPAALFAVGAIMSFAMGSAWGTFAILMPIAITVAHGMGVSLIPPIAAVLSGGLFGDHASPISDTTILASMGSGCRHIDHVRTQLPYALIPAAISVAAYGIAAVWESWWVLVAAVTALVLSVVALAKRWGTPIPQAER